MEHPNFNVGEAIFFGKGKFNYFNDFLAITDQKKIELGILNNRIRFKQNQSSLGKNILELACYAPKLSKFLKFNREQICGSIIQAVWEQEPFKENKVTLSKKLDYLGVPKTKLYWKKTKNDLMNVRKTLEVFASTFIKENIGRIKIYPYLNDGNFPQNENLASSHHIGGTRMSNNPNNGVVDKNCKVYGQENLYVLGSSIFPTGGYTNPTLPIIQFSIRLAEHLLKKIHRMNDALRKNILIYLIFLVFLLIYVSPLVLQLFQSGPTGSALTFFGGTNYNGGTRTIQYLPILREIVSERNLFENSVYQFLPAVNFENIRIIPFLIAAFPSLFSSDMSVIILFNHLIGYSLNVLVIYLIINKFINNKVLSIYLSTTCFLASGIIKFQITSTLINYLLIQNRIFLDYSHISANIDLIFQTLSNFILLLFVYLFINFKETSSIKKLSLLILVFIFLGFSYQVHLIIGYAIVIISYFLDIFKKRIRSNLLFFSSTIIFIIISILQVILIKQGSWSSADYSEFNTLKGFISEILNLFEKMSIKNILKFLINSFF